MASTQDQREFNSESSTFHATDKILQTLLGGVINPSQQRLVTAKSITACPQFGNRSDAAGCENCAQLTRRVTVRGENGLVGALSTDRRKVFLVHGSGRLAFPRDGAGIAAEKWRENECLEIDGSVGALR